MKLIKARKSRLERKAVRIICKKIKKLSKKQNKVVLGLIGGSSVQGIYKRLSKERIPWKKVHIFLLDERLVSIKSKQSNSRLIKDSLINKLVKKKRLPEANFHPFSYSRKSKISDYTDSFKKYKKFDIVLLSAGEHGHIASLFPNHSSIKNNSNFFIKTTNSPKPPSNRLSASKNLILTAETSITLFLGESKKQALEKYLNKKTPITLCPVKLTHKIKENWVLTDLKV